MRLATVATALVLWFQVLVPSLSFSADIWYEDNNLGKASGMPKDFFSKFENPKTFEQASSYIDVYMLHASDLIKMQDVFLKNVFSPYLKKHNIKLAIDVGGATWAQAEGRDRVATRELEQLARLKKLGIVVDFVSMQSVLSKPLKVKGQGGKYSLENRIEDVVAYSKEILKIYPHVEIGIIDALPSHGEDYRRPYRQLKAAMAQKNLTLGYVHLDMPFEIPREHKNGISWKTVNEVEQFVETELGAKFGLLVTSKVGGQRSSQKFHQNVLASMECFAGSGGTPRDFILASWFPYPDLTVPETSAGDVYPAMRTVLELGRKLEQIEQAGADWPRQRSGQPEWQNVCGTSSTQLQ